MKANRESTLLERLTFFSDAVFAIAITLLVIEIRPPVLHGADDAALRAGLLALAPNYIGFIVSFFVIGRFWLGHHRLFGQLARADDRLVFANLVLLLGIAFLPFPTAVFSEYANLRTATLFYAGWLVVLGLFNANVVRLALRPSVLAPDHDPLVVRRIRYGVWLPILIGLGAAAGAYVAPVWVLSVLVLGPVLGAALLRWIVRAPPSEG
ncbi:TMEM175 family protein [Sphingomonas sp. CJ20]